MAAKLTTLTHKIALQLYLVAESCIPFAVIAPGGQSGNFWIHPHMSVHPSRPSPESVFYISVTNSIFQNSTTYWYLNSWLQENWNDSCANIWGGNIQCWGLKFFDDNFLIICQSYCDSNYGLGNLYTATRL